MIASLLDARVVPEPADGTAGRPAPSAGGPVRHPVAGNAAMVVCVGVSFRTAPVALRERLALGPDQVSATLARLGCSPSAETGAPSELVILSTCNRLELYAPWSDGVVEALVSLIEDSTGVQAGELEPVLYTLAGAEAARHLCRTAAGLESMVIGEPQILGQISEAYAQALGRGAAGHAMAALFRGAIRAGRRARSETGINRNPATVSSVAVKLVGGAVRDLASASVLVVGAGEMAELALAALHYRGVHDVCVVSRTREHAERVAGRFGGDTAPFERLQERMAGVDVVVSSTSAPHHVITRAMVATAMARRPERSLVIVDIALPRDVEPSVAALPNVTYLDLDDLQRNVTHSLEERDAEIPKVEQIVEEEAAEVIAVLRQLDVEPLIADLRAHMEEIRVEALRKAQRHLARLGLEERAQVEAFSTALVNKLFHQPTTRLRAEARRGQVAGYAMALRFLFDLS